jgi:hypothetical protein
MYFLALCALAACQKAPTQDDLVRKNAETLLLEKMNDPASYEFVKLELRDSLLIQQHVDFRRGNAERDLQRTTENLERQRNYQQTVPSIYDAGKVQSLEKEMAKDAARLAAITALAESLGDRMNEVESYIYLMSFRANNAMGAKILNDYLIQVSAEEGFPVIHVGEKPDDLIFRPEGFPGYEKLIGR